VVEKQLKQREPKVAVGEGEKSGWEGGRRGWDPQ